MIPTVIDDSLDTRNIDDGAFTKITYKPDVLTKPPPPVPETEAAVKFREEIKKKVKTSRKPIKRGKPFAFYGGGSATESVTGGGGSSATASPGDHHATAGASGGGSRRRPWQRPRRGVEDTRTMGRCLSKYANANTVPDLRNAAEGRKDV